MKAFVAVGANIGNALTTIAHAIKIIDGKPSTRVTRVSKLYVTEPVGGPRQADYKNGVIELETSLPPADLMKELLSIERELGRVRRVKWGPRVIDLDLLAMDRCRVKSAVLTLPHPRYHERRFVLVPFCDVAPRFLHPVKKRQNRSLLRKLTMPGQRVTIFAEWNGTRFILSKAKKNPKHLS